MGEKHDLRPGESLRNAAAFGVHVFTAFGAALALLALLAAVQHQWTLMFVWLGVALLVDGIDGTLARLLHVEARLPRWSGDVIDLVVDILTYVFIPAYAIVASGLLPGNLVAEILGMLIAVTGVLYFGDRRMKSTDHHFIGFPALWNLVVFYLFVLQPRPWIAAAMIVLFCILTFVPVPFVHPVRVVRFRIVNIAMLALWSVLALIALATRLDPGPLVSAGLSLIAIYFIAAGALRRYI